MSSKFQRYSSIKEEVREVFFQSSPGFLFSIIIGFFSSFLASAGGDLFRNYRNILCENLALDSIYLFFFFTLIAWGFYIAALSIIPAIYICFNENTMIGISRSFIIYSSVSLGILIGVRLSLTILKLAKSNLVEKICGIEYNQFQFYYIFIFSFFFIVFIPYYWILKPIAEPKRKNLDSRSYYQINLYKFKSRFILFLTGVFIVYISTTVLRFTTLHIKS
jgi:hypothetical protein